MSYAHSNVTMKNCRRPAGRVLFLLGVAFLLSAPSIAAGAEDSPTTTIQGVSVEKLPGDQDLTLVKYSVPQSQDIEQLSLSFSVSGTAGIRSLAAVVKVAPGFQPSAEIAWMLADGVRLYLYGICANRGRNEFAITVVAGLDRLKASVGKLAETGAVMSVFSRRGAEYPIDVPAEFFARLAEALGADSAR